MSQRNKSEIKRDPEDSIADDELSYDRWLMDSVALEPEKSKVEIKTESTLTEEDTRSYNKEDEDCNKRSEFAESVHSLGRLEDAEQVSNKQLKEELDKCKKEKQKLQEMQDECLRENRELQAKVLRREMDKQILLLYDSLNKAQHNRVLADADRCRAHRDSLGVEVADLKEDKKRMEKDLTESLSQLVSERGTLYHQLETQRININCLQDSFNRCTAENNRLRAEVHKLREGFNRVSDDLRRCIKDRNSLRLELDLHREAVKMLIE